MNELEERLQERLARLEAGEPLAACLAGLPEDEAALLTLAADLPQAMPVLDEETAVSQRAALQRLVQQDNAPAVDRPGFGARLLAWWRAQTMIQRRGLVTAVVTTLLILIVVGFSPFASDQTAVSPEIAGTAAESETAVAEAAIPASVSESTAAPDMAEIVPTVESGDAVFIPLVQSPDTAVLDDIHGFVEVLDDDGEWTAVTQPMSLAAEQRLRTGSLSRASLTFFDGSQAQIGPNSELSLDTIAAQLPANGFRTVVMTQWSGESEHHVQFRSDNGSRYEVKSPYGSGIARGTVFRVQVTADSRASYTVSEGRVDVTGADRTVSVTPGQISTIAGEEPPTDPTFLVIGEGEVSQIGDEWVVGGQIFQTDDQTIVVGSPQVGDWVRVEGRLLPDGARLADRITLLRPSLADRFTIVGQVDAIDSAEWTVAGQTIAIDGATDIETGISVGDVVQVDGLIQANGRLLAKSIRLVVVDAGLPFEFTGVVQGISGDTWLISGITIATNADTEIKGEVAVGDVVRVEGWIGAGDVWLADEIKLVEAEESRFEIAGKVDSIDPWSVAGISFAIGDWTEIEDGIVVGDLVKVEGHILPDGTWVADEIKLLDEEDHLTFEFYGTVGSTAPWVVSGIALPVTEETAVTPNIMVGDLVKGTITILPDGSWQVVSIVLVNSAGDDMGCFSVTAVVRSFSDDQLTIDNWPVFQLGGDVELDGPIQPGSVITLYACVGEDGRLVILDIIIFSTLQPAITPEPPPSDAGGHQVTICHKPNSKNAHTITVDQSAVQAHLDHGDTLGACP
ncbi:MAG: FecR domain-containing protein [Ardenticatenaceae bacterium]|nr:FecR domain-containing protein [Ardenticatenaceae bacterium]MCB9445980.1 FecR domain-containing protein [Ardenticatenaceae bacterium]